MTITIATFITLLFLSAFLSGSETAYFSLSPIFTKKFELSDIASEKRAARNFKDPQKLLSGILAGNILVNTVAATLMASIIRNALGPKYVVLAVPITTVLLLIFAEMTPKSFAASNNVTFVTKGAFLLQFIYILVTPLRIIVEGIASLFIKDLKRETDIISKKDLKAVLKRGYKKGSYKFLDKEALTRALRLDEIIVEDLMINRTKVEVMNSEWDREKIISKLNSNDLASAAIYDPGEKDVVGWIKRKDLILSSPEKPLSELLIEGEFFPKNQTITDVIQPLAKHPLGKGFVVDEHGEFSGIIDLDRITKWMLHRPIFLRNISEEKFHKIGDTTLCPADISLDEFNHYFGTSLESSYYQSIGGFIMEHIDGIPDTGEELELQGLQIRIVRATDRKVKLVGVKEKAETDKQ